MPAYYRERCCSGLLPQYNKLLPILVFLSSIVVSSLIVAGKVKFAVFFAVIFLALCTSSATLLAVLIISFQIQLFLPNIIKLGSFDLQIIDIIYSIILLKAFVTITFKKNRTGLNKLNFKLVIPIMLFWLAALFSLIIPVEKLDSVNLGLQISSLLRFSLYLLVPFLVPIVITNRKQIHIIIKLLIYIALLQFIISIGHFLLLAIDIDFKNLFKALTAKRELFSFKSDGFIRITGTLGDPSQMAFNFLVCFFLSIELSIIKNRIAMRFIPILLLCGVFLTHTRTAWFSFVMAILFSLFVPKVRSKKIFLPMVLTTAIMILFFIVAETMLIPIRVSIGTLMNRFAGWLIAWKIFLENIWFGAGWSGYRFLSEEYFTIAMNVMSPSDALGFASYTSSLGLYTQIACDLGLFGIAALVYLLSSLLKYAWQSTFIIKDEELRCLSRGILFIIVAFCFYSILDVTFFAGSNLTFTFFLIIGLLIASRNQQLNYDKKAFGEN
jgi:hypothetical protein